MRKVVVAKALVLMILSLYLAIGLGGTPTAQGDAGLPTATAHQKLLR
jgi:hypothetical protein